MGSSFSSRSDHRATPCGGRTGLNRARALGRTSGSSPPTHHVLERLAIQVAAEVVTKDIHAPVEVHVGLARYVRRDEHARVVPEAVVGVASEFPAVDVERGPTDLAGLAGFEP
jgi:hypothetical protein